MKDTPCRKPWGFSLGYPFPFSQYEHFLICFAFPQKSRALFREPREEGASCCFVWLMQLFRCPKRRQLSFLGRHENVFLNGMHLHFEGRSPVEFAAYFGSLYVPFVRFFSNSQMHSTLDVTPESEGKKKGSFVSYTLTRCLQTSPRSPTLAVGAAHGLESDYREVKRLRVSRANNSAIAEQ